MTLAIIIAGAAAGGFVQGLSGFAFGLVALAFWAWVVEPEMAGPMVVFGSLLGQLVALRMVRIGFRSRHIPPLLLGGLGGVPVGVALLDIIDPTGFQLMVGLVLMAFCPALLMAAALPRVGGGRAADAAVGVVGGVMGGLGGLSGPAPTLWCALHPWSKDEQRAIIQTFNLGIHVLALSAYGLAGNLGPETLRMCLLIAPVLLLPALLGARLYDHLNDRAFRRLVLVLLTLSGVALVAGAVRTLLS